MFYFFIFAFIAILGMLDISKKYVVLRNDFAGLIIIILFVIAGFRYETGMDWKRYEEIFNSVKSAGSISSFSDIFNDLDIGYQLLSITIKSFGGDIQVVFIVMQLIGSIFLWKTLKKYTEYKLSAILIYYSLLFFLLDLNLMRQMVAANIFFFSISFIREKKMWTYFGLILLAFSFHWSVLLFLPMYFILNLRLSSTTIYTSVLLFVLFFIFQIKTGELLYTITEKIFGDTEITNRVSFYTTKNIYAVNRAFSFGFFLNLLIIMATMLNRKDLEKVTPYFNIFLNLMLIQLFFYFVMYEYIEVSGRLRFYTLISYIIIIPYFFQIYKFLFNRIIVYIFIVLYGLSYSYIYMIPNKQTIAYNPYQNYILHKIFNMRSSGEKRLKEYHLEFDKERKQQIQ